MTSKQYYKAVTELGTILEDYNYDEDDESVTARVIIPSGVNPYEFIDNYFKDNEIFVIKNFKECGVVDSFYITFIDGTRHYITFDCVISDFIQNDNEKVSNLVLIVVEHNQIEDVSEPEEDEEKEEDTPIEPEKGNSSCRCSNATLLSPFGLDMFNSDFGFFPMFGGDFGKMFTDIEKFFATPEADDKSKNYSSRSVNYEFDDANGLKVTVNDNGKVTTHTFVKKDGKYLPNCSKDAK